MPGFRIVRLKNKPTSSVNITVETEKPENQKEEFTVVSSSVSNTVITVEPENKKKESTVVSEVIREEKKVQPIPHNKLTYEEINGKAPTAEKEPLEKREETGIIMPTAETEKSAITEMKIITSKPKERVTCECCQRSFGTALFMYDYSEGSRKLVGCCPYCNEIIGKPPSKKIAHPEIEKPTRLQENAKKKEPTSFQVNSEELQELIKNTAYVR